MYATIINVCCSAIINVIQTLLCYYYKMYAAIINIIMLLLSANYKHGNSPHLKDHTRTLIVEPEDVVNCAEVVDTIARRLLYTTGQALEGAMCV